MSTNNRGGPQHPPPPPDPVLVLSGKNSVTSLVSLGSDGLLSGHQNGLIQEWSLPIRRAVATWSAHSDTVLWLTTFLTTSNVNDEPVLLLSQGRDGLVKTWNKHSDNTNQWSTIDQIPSAPLIFCCSAVINSSSGTFLATPSQETSLVNIHQMSNTSSSSHKTSCCIAKSPIHVLKPPDLKGYGMCMRMCAVTTPSQDSIFDGYLLVGYESGAIALWNVLEGEMAHSLRIHDDSVMGLTCWSNPTSKQVVGLSASVGNIIQFWKISDNSTIFNDNCVSVTNEGFNDIAIRKDGRIFVTGGWDGRGRVFSLKKLRPLAVLTYHKESINCVAFAPNNELILASKDGYITFWDVYKNS